MLGAQPMHHTVVLLSAPARPDAMPLAYPRRIVVAGIDGSGDRLPVLRDPQRSWRRTAGVVLQGAVPARAARGARDR